MAVKKRKGFSAYVASALQNSMLTGIPQIAAAGNLAKKVIRSVVFVVCMAGFIYQSLIFMNMYWQFETVVDVQVEDPKMVDLPAVTVCNDNGFLQSKVCGDPELSDRCFTFNGKSLANLCHCKPRYCRHNIANITSATGPLLTNMTSWPYEKKKKYFTSLPEFVTHCELQLTAIGHAKESCNMSHYQRINCPSVNLLFQNSCFTLNTILGRPDKEPQQVLSSGFSQITFDPMVKEYSSLIQEVGLQISVHSPRNIISPYQQGFRVKLGQVLVIRLKKVVKNLLPPPYETNCVDYISMWKARGGWGPTNEKECIDECAKNESLKDHQCIDRNYDVPGNEARCNENYPQTPRLVQKCSEERCRPACYEESYVVSLDASDNDLEPDCEEENSTDDLISVRLDLDGMETTIFTYSPKFQTIETFSYLGGYVGMWLGISLLAVFDFFETLVVMAKYPIQKYFLQKKKKLPKKIDDMNTRNSERPYQN